MKLVNDQSTSYFSFSVQFFGAVFFSSFERAELTSFYLGPFSVVFVVTVVAVVVVAVVIDGNDIAFFIRWKYLSGFCITNSGAKSGSEFWSMKSVGWFPSNHFPENKFSINTSHGFKIQEILSFMFSPFSWKGVKLPCKRFQ